MKRIYSDTTECVSVKEKNKDSSKRHKRKCFKAFSFPVHRHCNFYPFILPHNSTALSSPYSTINLQVDRKLPSLIEESA